MNKCFGALLAACTVLSSVMACKQDPAGKEYSGNMTPEVLLSFGRISDPCISPDKSLILYGVSYQNLEKNNSCRNLFIVPADGSSPEYRLTNYSTSVSNARWSADGKEIYFLQGGQLYKAPFLGKKLGKKVCLSDVPAGISGFSISPDGSKLLYISSIPGPVKTPKDSDPALDKASAYAVEDLMYRHWDHWVTEVPRSFVADLGAGKITPENSRDLLGEGNLFELPTEPFGGIEQLSWSPDSRFIAYSCRKKKGREYAFSTNSEIFIYDCLTHKTSQITHGGGYDTGPLWSPDGSRLAWISMARDGYESDLQRLMTAEINGLEAKKIQRIGEDFDYDVESLLWSGENLYFHALCPPGVKALFRADGKGKISRLTPPDLYCDFSAPAAKIDGGILCLCCSMERPHAICLVSEDGVRIILDENEEKMSGLQKISQRSVSIKTTDGKDMQAWVLYPPGFSEDKRYPAIEIVLGGPQGTNSQCWSYRWCYRFFAQNGFVVILPNRRGTTAFGQQWKEQISGDYCGQNIQDYLSAAKWTSRRTTSAP